MLRDAERALLPYGKTVEPLADRDYLTQTMTTLAPALPTFVPDRRYSVAQWLAIEEASGERYEYHGGRLVSVRAMAGGSYRHALLIGNVTIELGNAVRNAPDEAEADCHVLSSDLQLAAASDEKYYYPDAAIVCGPPKFDEVVPTAVVNPICVVEVLSPSSAGFDTGDKFDYYSVLETLRDYLIVHQDRKRVEVRSRASANAPWRYSITVAPDERVELPGIGHAVKLSGMYRGWDNAPSSTDRNGKAAS